MSLENFNAETTRAVYSYQRSPVYDRSFQLLKKETAEGAFVPVGDYTVLDQKEDPVLTEKKLMNLVTLLNGGKNLIALGDETKSRLLYHHAARPEDNNGKTRIVFYTLGEVGVSRENAVLNIEGEL